MSCEALKRWRLIEPQLERVYALTYNGLKVAELRKEIMAEYGKLEAKSLIELIHAFYYADIPVLFEITCHVVKHSDLGKFSFEQINSLSRDMGNRIILDNVLRLGGPMLAKEFAVCMGHNVLLVQFV